MKTSNSLLTLETARRNTFRSWRPSAKHGENTAAARFALGEFITVQHTPKFKIPRATPIFTMGSCFARNIENKLMREGMDVLTGDFSLPIELYNSADLRSAVQKESPMNGHRGVLNKYNVHSMLMELSRALEPYPLPDDGLIEVGDGQWYDPQSSNLKPNRKELMQQIRYQIQAVTAKCQQAEIIFLTLGLTETWFDTVTRLSLNTPPSPAHIKKLSARFEFSNPAFPEIFECLEMIVQLLQRTARPDHKLVITVSPVPMGVTFTADDVITANNRSKSTLVAAATALAESFEHVDYFPSYEMVTLSNRRSAYADDCAHVQSAMVQHVVNSFTQLYLADRN
jgi:hypothetical protein